MSLHAAEFIALEMIFLNLGAWAAAAVWVQYQSREDRGEDGCGCPFDYPYTCPVCGHARITNHCPHDGVQNPCPECGHLDPGKVTPLQFLGMQDD